MSCPSPRAKKSRPSQAEHSLRNTRRAAPASGGSGAEWSRWKKTVPVIWDTAARPVLEGLAGEVRHRHGDAPLVPGAYREEGERDLLDDARLPPSTTTVSPMRTTSPKAIWSPAKMLLRVDCAATPATTPRMPAEASSEAPAARIGGNVISITGHRHHADDRRDHPLDERDLRAHPAQPRRVA